ncbi:MAG: NAD-dependent epimerase/dehydratase family protein, partial [Oscillospiraceae bacterium]
MKILVTGAKGFIGKNLITGLYNKGYNTIYQYDTDTSEEQLDFFIENCDFIFHLAGVNRSIDTGEFERVNKGLTCSILSKLEKANNPCPILVSSSIRADENTAYGISKKQMEEEVFSYGKNTGAQVYVYRLANVFGKWCRPNYNSVIATFCYNISRGLPINIYDSETMLNLVYIDDMVDEFI